MQLGWVGDAAGLALGCRGSMLPMCPTDPPPHPLTPSHRPIPAVPAFDLVIAVIAAIGDVAAPYTLPCLFALVLLPGLCRSERALLKVLVPVSALFACFGLYAASYRLVEVLSR